MMLYVISGLILLISLALISYMLSNKAMRKILDEEVDRRMKD